VAVLGPPRHFVALEPRPLRRGFFLREPSRRFHVPGMSYRSTCDLAPLPAGPSLLAGPPAPWRAKQHDGSVRAADAKQQSECRRTAIGPAVEIAWLAHWNETWPRFGGAFSIARVKRAPHPAQKKPRLGVENRDGASARTRKKRIHSAPSPEPTEEGGLSIAEPKRVVGTVPDAGTEKSL
jgi:hypothetical protein